MIYQFETEIQFDATRNVTKLPFKTDHYLLPDNFKVAKIRLQNLKQRLLKENVFEIYDKIFKDNEKCAIIKRFILMRYLRFLGRYVISPTGQFCARIKKLLK